MSTKYMAAYINETAEVEEALKLVIRDYEDADCLYAARALTEVYANFLRATLDMTTEHEEFVSAVERLVDTLGKQSPKKKGWWKFW